MSEQTRAASTAQDRSTTAAGDGALRESDCGSTGAALGGVDAGTGAAKVTQ